MTEQPEHTTEAQPIEPDDALADLSDADQVGLVEPTDNALTAEDAALPQPEPPAEAAEGEG